MGAQIDYKDNRRTCVIRTLTSVVLVSRNWQLRDGKDKCDNHDYLFLRTCHHVIMYIPKYVSFDFILILIIHFI
jgi:hypothetical protein